MLNDGNAIVVSMACAALSEISRSAGKNYLKFKKGGVLNKVLSAITDSNEWGQIYILEAVANHEVEDAKEAENIIERVLPRLAHNNPAVILSAVKCCLRFMEDLDKEDLKKGIIKKLAAPMITLMSCEAEI
jgi:vesicle coat complex subunit